MAASIRDKLRRLPRWAGWTLLILVVLLVAVRLALPILARRVVNQKLSQVPGYVGHVQRVGIHLYRGAYSLDGVEIRKGDGAISQPYLSADTIDFSLAWKYLLRGRMVSRIGIEHAQINFVRGKEEASSQLKVDRRWQDVISALFPIDITQLEIRDSLVHFVDNTHDPKVDVYVRNLRLAADGLRNRPSRRADAAEFPATLSLIGDTIGGGHLVLNLQLEPLATQPHFYFTLVLDSVSLPALNDFLLAYGNVEVSAGDFRVVSEIGANGGRIEGYVKPFFHAVSFAAPDNKSRGPLHAIWQTIVAGLTNLLKNKSLNQLGTKIPISGDFNDYHAGTLQAVVNLIGNGFVHALPRTVEGTVNPEAIPPANSGGTPAK
ncbi:MAG TPA: DUF748 domain-containing protein [Opitutaceae bacterium]|jgi:hypothetical protein|nr:DUF748 domain-containing protein [Opitutaceae bacterium]